MRARHQWSLMMVAGFAATAAGQVSPVGPFTGPHTEGFETQPAVPDTLYSCLPGRIFNGAADACEPTMNSLVVPTFWSMFCQATPHGGTRYILGVQGPIEVTFDAPATRFGGYFATAGGLDGALVTFLDASGPIGTVAMTTSQCDWTWNGWESTAPFTRVSIVGNSPFGQGGYIHMDDLEYLGTGAPCYANCDASTGSPVLTANDFQCFLNRFATGESYANCDGSSGVPMLTANDFQCFLNRYATGCP
jgi:hypothetical protein